MVNNKETKKQEARVQTAKTISITNKETNSKPNKQNYIKETEQKLFTLLVDMGKPYEKTKLTRIQVNKELQRIEKETTTTEKPYCFIAITDNKENDVEKQFYPNQTKN